MNRSSRRPRRALHAPKPPGSVAGRDALRFPGRAPREAPSFLELPERSRKPRDRGITCVLDRGLSLASVDGLIEVAGDAVDLVKLGWGTAVVMENLDAKLARYRQHGIPVVLGGTLTELAVAQGRVDGLVDWLGEIGLRHVEVSDGAIRLPHAEKLALIERLAGDFTVLSEVGAKDAARGMAPDVWVTQIERELEAGAWKVIAEARESGTAGIYHADGSANVELIDEIAAAVPADRLLFEAPRKEQQAWLVRRFGANVNLANIAADDVVAVETLRLGLRFDTMPRP
ncbi:MAG: phosphosulfolactate synthase [Solirubrobacteraceae bacterium]|jgi:phosphosulfolactate synthase|nr:phosphosulfolactate synthase [Solirubrobacteraceae bacterium]